MRWGGEGGGGGEVGGGEGRERWKVGRVVPGWPRLSNLFEVHVIKQLTVA